MQAVDQKKFSINITQDLQWWLGQKLRFHWDTLHIAVEKEKNRKTQFTFSSETAGGYPDLFLQFWLRNDASNKTSFLFILIQKHIIKNGLKKVYIVVSVSQAAVSSLAKNTKPENPFHTYTTLFLRNQAILIL